MTWLSLGAPLPAATWPGSPVALNVHELVSNSDHYDGQRVLVSGIVRSVEFQQGRRGSEYIVLILEDSGATPHGREAVTVVTFVAPRLTKCAHAWVQGVYHREGKQGGRPYERFIEAEVIRPRDASPFFPPEDCNRKA